MVEATEQPTGQPIDPPTLPCFTFGYANVGRGAGVKSRYGSLLIRVLFFGAVAVQAAVAQQSSADTGLHYVANTKPPDAFLALRTQPTSGTGVRIMAMPNGTPLRVLERRAEGWWRVKVEPSGQEGWALAYQGNRTWIECCLTTTASSAPQAEAPDGFKTPSGNIHCQSFATETEKGRPGRTVRCDIRNISNRLPPRPRDCELEWGQAFEVDTAARAGERLCYGDSVEDDKLRPLPYGETWARGGLRCKSEASGVTCVNPSGHGFEISRNSQRVF
jgi:hypothetical protein